MTIDSDKIARIEDSLRNTLRDKFQNYAPEPAYMPFQARLLGKDRLALYSFIHSLTTSFGTSFYEPAAVILAENRFASATRGCVAGSQISESTLHIIQELMDGLTTTSLSPNKSDEVEKIRVVCRDGIMRRVKPTKIDVMVETFSGEIYLFDIKTAKPNAGNFKDFKRTLLEWVGVVLASNPDAHINTLIAIPYNPYEPEPYNRWTIRGMLDLEHELKVAAEFWDFLGGDGAYQELLNCFERVGVELRSEIDQYFSRFNRG